MLYFSAVNNEACKAMRLVIFDGPVPNKNNVLQIICNDSLHQDDKYLSTSGRTAFIRLRTGNSFEAGKFELQYSGK